VQGAAKHVNNPERVACESMCAAQLSEENYNSCLADDHIELLSILDRQSTRATLAPINA
jgi:hypothetical protein